MRIKPTWTAITQEELQYARSLVAKIDGVRTLVSKRGTAIVTYEARAFINGKRQSESFSAAKCGTLEKAAAAAKTWLADVKHVNRVEGTGVIPIPPETRRVIEYYQCQAEQMGLTLDEVFRLGMEELTQRKETRSITFAQAKDRAIELKEKEGISPSYLRDIKRIWGNFADTFGHTVMCEISVEHVEEWLDEHDVEPVTYNNLRRNLVTLWNVGLYPRFKWVSENVAEQIRPRKVDASDVEILTVSDVSDLLKYADEHFPRLIPYLCLGMFAGLRISEIKKSEWGDFDWERGTIKVRGKVRSMASRYVDLEPVLVDWIKPLAQPSGAICTLERTADIEKLRQVTYDFPSNVFRHTYGSYHWGAFQNPQRTAMEMGHSNLQMLYKYYRKPLPQKIAAPFWELSRVTVLGGKDSEGGIEAAG